MTTFLHPHGPATRQLPPMPRTGPWWARGLTATVDGLTLPLRLSAALVAVCLSAFLPTVLFPDILRGPDMTVGSARGTALVIVVIALPVLIWAMAAAARGSSRALPVWLGALTYITYNAMVFTFAITFNGLFLLYVAALSLALWSTITLLMRVDMATVRACFTPALPVRTIAAFLVATAALFFLFWMRGIVPALLDNTVPEDIADAGMLTNPFHVMDFAVMHPITLLTALWLVRRRAWGYLLAGAFLLYGVIESLSVAADQFYAGVHDPEYSMAAVPLFIVLAAISAIPLVLYFRGMRASDAE